MQFAIIANKIYFNNGFINIFKNIFYMDFLDRLKIEAIDLSIKLNGLNLFLSKDENLKKVSETQQMLLNAQSNAMQTYLNILVARLQDLGIDTDELFENVM